MTQDYQIKLDIFEGPLDLLLYLVTKDEVDIRDIQVARVCEQFVEYLDLMKELDIEIAGEYMVMAATLIRLKARELLPKEAVDEQLVEGDMIDREQLIQQLLEYKKYKEAASTLRRFEDQQRGTFYKAVPEPMEWSQDFEEPGIEVGVFDLLTAFKNVLERKALEQVSHDIVRDDVRLDDRIEHVLSYLYDHPVAKFEELFADIHTRMSLVVTFMSILELMKMEQIAIRQEMQFGQIWVYKRNEDGSIPYQAQEKESQSVEQKQAPE